jgi:uncharacterized protein (DUF433 family)
MHRHIVADPNICHGKAVFRGTRIMVWQVLELLEAGETLESILRAYPSLTKEAVKEALRYAAEVLRAEHHVVFPS